MCFIYFLGRGGGVLFHNAVILCCYSDDTYHCYARTCNANFHVYIYVYMYSAL